MPTSYIQIEELLSEVQLGSFNLSSIHGFPESEYNSRRMLYDELLTWYDGTKLAEKQVQGGRVVDKYPIKLNPIRSAVVKHAYALFGEVNDDSQPLAVPIFRPDDMDLKEDARAGQTYLNRVWYDNHGRTLQLSNGLTSQILGGCVFKASYVPERKYIRQKVRVETIHPSNFVAIPMAGDQYRLEEAWIVKAMSPHEAYRLYGMEFNPNELVYYVEYYNPEYYEVTINGRVVPTNQTDPVTGKTIMYQGENIFGEVPIVYIPHIRSDGFWGDSLISENVKGIVEEINKRVADYGDAVSDDSHRYYVIKNTSGRPDVYELSPGVRVIQLPANPRFTGKEGDPDMDELGSAQASTSMKELNDQLYDHFRREAYIPAVADGEDEGSQRSALTLAMRMWPLLSHTSMERVYWSDGLALLDSMIIRLARRQKLASLPETLEGMRIERKWAPMLPRDHEVMVNELVNRAQANLGSIETLLHELDVEDPAGEYERILEQIKQLAEIEQSILMKQQQAFQNTQRDAEASASNKE